MTLGSSEGYGTINAAGIYASYSGDDNGNLAAWVEYRESGSGGYQRGHDLLPIAAGRLAGSLFFLKSNTDYDVRVIIDDPDNGALETTDLSVKTRPNQPLTGNGTTIYVDASAGDDANPGTDAAPLATIQSGADLAQPGDTVLVRAGTYRESVTPPRGGEAGNPITFRAENNLVLLDGASVALESASWSDEGGGIYSTPFAGESQYVAVDDQRIYDYPSLAGLQSGIAGIDGGYAIESGVLYLKLPDGSSPSGKRVAVAVLDFGFLLDTLSHVVVEGFRFAHYGATKSGVAVDVRDSSRTWVRFNVASYMNTGFRVRRSLASENVIEHNQFLDNGSWDWPWDAVKGDTPEASAISVQHGRGNVVRFNQTQGAFNGIGIGAFGSLDEELAKDTDVYGNVSRFHGDDGLEPESACVNVRMWHNVVIDVKNAISLAPIDVGPTWVLRTLVAGYTDHVLKLNNGSSGWILVYHNTGVPAPTVDSAQALAPSIPFGPLVARNNIFEANRYVIEYGETSTNPGVDFDFDNLWTRDPARFVKWLDVRYDDIAALSTSNTIEANGFELEPAYEDPSSETYRLVAGHGLVDVGVEIPGINTRFIEGAGPDVGAYERDGVSPWEDPVEGGGVAGSGSGGAGQGGSGQGGSGQAGSGQGGSAQAGSSQGGSGQAGSGQAGSGASAGAGGASSASGSGSGSGEDGGCGCSVPGRRPVGPGGWLLLVLGFSLGAARVVGGAKRRASPRVPS